MRKYLKGKKQQMMLSWKKGNNLCSLLRIVKYFVA